MGAQILSIILILLIGALFSGFEFALMQVHPVNNEIEQKAKGFGISIISGLYKDRVQYASTLLFGNIFIMVLLCYFSSFSNTATQSITPVNLALSIAIQILILSILLISFGHFIPLLLFGVKAELSMNLISIPITILYYLIYPVVKILMETSVLVSKLIDKEKKYQKNHFTLFIEGGSSKNLNDENEEHAPAIKVEHDVKIFQNALDFSKVKLRECAIPRNEIEAVELQSPIEKIKEKFIETGFSKILVYQDSIDNIIGYAQSVDIFQSPNSISSILKTVVIVPETMPANKLLNMFLKEHKNIAVVVDEFGGTFGIATIEDIMEEIFGEIEDEHDSTDLEEEKLSESEFIFSGRLEIDYINEKYNIGIPESEDYATIAGFILYFNEEIPKENDKIKIFRFEFEILKLHNPKIELVKLKLLKKA